MGFWRTLFLTIARHPISFFAVLCVAATGGWLAYMSERQLDVLESPNWCGRVMGAEKGIPGPTSYAQALEVLKGCNEILKLQLQAIAMDSHIDHSVFGLGLLVLVIVVLAGARAAWKINIKEGVVEGDVRRHDEVEAAVDHVVEGTVAAAEEVK
jgi:hypothetical protein